MSQHNQSTDDPTPTTTLSQNNETHEIIINSNQQFVADSLLLKDIKNEICNTQVKLWSDKMTPELSQEMSHIEFLRLRNLLVEYVEELKLRRHNDVENEERIKHLVQEKYELERKCDNEKNKHSLLEEQHRKVTMETKRKFEERIQVLEEESRQNQVHRDCNTRETKALKDEIHNLQLEKYSLEKKLHDQERKLKLQLSTSEQHLSQLSKVDQKFNVLTTYCKQLVDNQSRLDRNVKEAVKLNQILMYVNEHQKCIVEQQKDDITRLQEQIVKLKAESQAKPMENNHIKYKQDIEIIKKQIKLLKTENDSLKKENSDLISKHQNGIEKLEDAHMLIERHMKNAELHKQEATTNFQNYKDSEKQINKLKQAMDKMNKELQIEKTIHKETVDKMKIQEKTWNEEIDDLKSELSKTQTACKELEELNTTWAKQNMEISQCLKEAKNRLDIDKADSSNQTDLCMLHMIDTECQVIVEKQSTQIQTDSPVVMTTQCQICPDTMTTYTQTVVVPVINKETQTLTLTSSESLREIGPINLVEGHLHDEDKNTRNSWNADSKTLCCQTVQEVKSQQMKKVIGHSTWGHTEQEVKSQPMIDAVGQPIISLLGDSCQSNMTNLVTFSNDKVSNLDDGKDSETSVPASKTLPFEYENDAKYRTERYSTKCPSGNMESSVKEDANNCNSADEQVHGETGREVDRNLMEIAKEETKDGTTGIPLTQKVTSTTTDVISLSATDSLSIKKTAGKRRLHSMEWKMEDQVDSSPLSSSYEPDVSSLWKRGAKRKGLDSLQFVESSNDNDRVKVRIDKNDHESNPSSHSEMKDEIVSEKRKLSNSDGYFAVLGRGASQNKNLSLKNTDKSTMFTKSIGLSVTKNLQSQKDSKQMDENKENVQTFLENSRNQIPNFQIRQQEQSETERKPSRSFQSTPIVTNHLFTNQKLDNQVTFSNQSNFVQDWARSSHQGDNQSENRSSQQGVNQSETWSRSSQQSDQSEGWSRLSQQNDSQSETWSRSSQQHDSQSDLSPYSRYSAKLRLTTSSSSTASVLYTELPSLNSKQTEMPELTSISKQVVREITAEENLVSSKGILKDPSISDVRQKQSKNVQFCEDIIMVSPAQSQVSGDQCLFSDPEDEAIPQTFTDTPIQQESPTTMKKPKLSDE